MNGTTSRHTPSSVFHLAVLATVLSVLLIPGRSLRAADLVEPWAPGLTNTELFFTTGESAADRELAGLVGFGIGPHLSLGLSYASPDQGDGGGLILLYTRPLGRWGEVDVWGELQVQAASMEAELGAAERAFGFEWSAPARWSGKAQPYVRLSAARSEGANRWHPLVGLRIPAGRRLDLHVELSGEEPDSGPWPVHLAVGPNLPLSDWLEVIPEVAVIEERGAGGDSSLLFTLGVVVDPSRWLRGFGTPGATWRGGR